MHPTRIFKSPEELYAAFEAYKKSLIERARSWPKVQYVGRNGERVEDYPKLPLTMEGFEVYCYDNHGTVEHYFKNTENYYDDFCPICSRIKREIRDDQITGGLLGDYNPSITQRLNGLVEKSQIDITEQPMFPDNPDSDE